MINYQNICLQLTKFALGYDFAKDYVFDMARKKVMKQTNGLYPAPLRILEVRHPNIFVLVGT
jgi:enoyl-CoA hydratase/long-chain 3-hydroxyacyl-CoA dehydrogenase